MLLTLVVRSGHGARSASTRNMLRAHCVSACRLMRKKRHGIRQTVFKNGAWPGAKDFLHFVLKKRRIEMLPFIVSSYISQYHKKKGLVTCKITTSCPIDEDTKERFKVIIDQKHHGKVEITTNVDSSLEGGFILEYDTYRLDASLKSQLQYIKRCLL